jgi:hypothetical protein
LRFEIHALEGGADCSERRFIIAVEENADKREESEISSPETGERLELVQANAREVCEREVCEIVWRARCRPTATECCKI